LTRNREHSTGHPIRALNGLQAPTPPSPFGFRVWINQIEITTQGANNSTSESTTLSSISLTLCAEAGVEYLQLRDSKVDTKKQINPTIERKLEEKKRGIGKIEGKEKEIVSTKKYFPNHTFLQTKKKLREVLPPYSGLTPSWANVYFH